jgi:GTP-binding protein
MSKFIDLVELEIEAGQGGDGKIAWRREKYEPYGGPFGGDGGNGGSVWLQATNSLNTLIDFRFKHEFKAPDGEKGRGARQSGKAGEDLIIRVPVGTVVYKVDGDEEVIVGDLYEDGQKLLLAQGGNGGRGNQHFATSTRQAPHFCEPGYPGQKLKIKLELKLIAHVGIIGLPNAGKSTLISRLSACKAKIGDYPFTTLTPNLGMLQLAPDKSLVIADIPGLIEGASDGVGLGFHFLRHIERTQALIHLIDGATEDVEECLQAYKTVNTELTKYNSTILDKRQILVINKKDSLYEEQVSEIRAHFAAEGLTELLFISAVSGEGIDELKKQLFGIYDQIQENKVFETEREVVEKIKISKDFKLTVDLEKRVFRVESPYLEGLVRVTDFKTQESVEHLFKKLKYVNLFQELKKHAINSGDTVLIGNRELVWSEFADEKLI